MFIGSELGVVEGTYQPMKIAAAEALWNTCDSHCPFSLFQIGGGNNDETPTQIFEIPDLLSILATNHLDGEVQGLNQLNAEYQKEYGPGNYIPNVFIQYWSMRVMAYLASLVMLFALWGAWLLWRRKIPGGPPPNGGGGKSGPPRAGGPPYGRSALWFLRGALGRHRCPSSSTPRVGCSPRTGANPGSSRG